MDSETKQFQIEEGKSYTISGFKRDSLQAVVKPINPAAMGELATKLSGLVQFASDSKEYEMFLARILNTYLVTEMAFADGVKFKEEKE